MIFGPIFFASIGLKTTLSGMNEKFRTLCHLFRHRRPCRKNHRLWPDVKGMRLYLGRQPEIGVGMMTRGEVCLIVAQKGLNAGFLSGDFFSAVILLILFSSVATPIITENLIRENADGQKILASTLTFLLPKQGAVPFPAQRPVFFVSTGKSDFFYHRIFSASAPSANGPGIAATPRCSPR